MDELDRILDEVLVDWWHDEREVDPLVEQVLEAVPRDLYEMEQVIPGAEDDWDPITEAGERNRFGDNRTAVRILRDVIEDEPRCIDAWVHLGVIELYQDRPAQARPHYETGVAIAEQTITADFTGVLSPGA